MFQPSSLPSLNGKTFLVTGGNTGIGYETCLNLAAHGARVFMGARSSQKATAAIAKITETYPQADVRVLLLNHVSLDSVMAAAKTFKSKEARLHGLILNAGIMAVPYEVTKDGFESQMQTNYLAHWLLTRELLPVLLATARSDGPGSARVVCVSSEGHRTFGVKKMIFSDAEVAGFGNFGRYGLSKLANVLQAKTLNDQYGPSSISSKGGNGEIWTGFLDAEVDASCTAALRHHQAIRRRMPCKPVLRGSRLLQSAPTA
ncbi:putative oxidoreductase [Hyphodiscus hymeniophilus]|uniref:Oxidoreductase n=1 Tax=Hyphodiscus hymeniophilus TaxID=353542 RepID=A0A9P7AZS4_9HELO|nr:putative oxidoreductase [Hyphodiscus hymeniophilus]